MWTSLIRLFFLYFPGRHNFDVKSKFEANNLAYTLSFLPLHIDLPQYDYVPGVSALCFFMKVQSHQMTLHVISLIKMYMLL